MILDNYGTHNHPHVKAWLENQPRFHCRFTPTSSSWLNLVERWFGEITRKRIRRSPFSSVSDLVHAIEQYIRLPSPSSTYGKTFMNTGSKKQHDIVIMV